MKKRSPSRMCSVFIFNSMNLETFESSTFDKIGLNKPSLDTITQKKNQMYWHRSNFIWNRCEVWRLLFQRNEEDEAKKKWWWIKSNESFGRSIRNRFFKNSSKELSTIKMFARRTQPFKNIIHFVFCLPTTTNLIQIPFNSILNNSFYFLYRSFAIVSIK